MLKTLLRVSLSLLFFAVLVIDLNAKVEARKMQFHAARRPVRAITKYYLYDSHREYLISPNSRYTVVWGQNSKSNRTRNYLYDIRGDKPVASIYACNGSPQGYGNITANWRADSQVALITYNGRWAPRDACLVSVNGAQINIYNRLQNDILDYLINSCDIKFFRHQDRVVIDFFRNQYLLKITNNQLTLLATLYVPNSGTYNQSFLMTYNYQIMGNQIYFKLASIRKT